MDKILNEIPTDAAKNIIYPYLRVAICLCVLQCTSPWIPLGVNDTLKRGPDTVTVTDDLTEG